MISRRNLLRSAGGLLVMAPFVAKPGVLMSVSQAMPKVVPSIIWLPADPTVRLFSGDSFVTLSDITRDYVLNIGGIEQRFRVSMI